MTNFDTFCIMVRDLISNGPKYVLLKVRIKMKVVKGIERVPMLTTIRIISIYKYLILLVRFFLRYLAYN